ncbi:NB-ARC domain-containing protein [Umezawaea sp. Da 62-37]|uniref:NB-ARC domain-containing protein n=1 Tax=Umezawaea sp. Da 62-37 TaxID=3075927 RepID=UPI0028F71519|nr:NB-ARC domain-containing protein [Umezawaea sp. Da 62-37]WNV91489.1 NB-ARC domain-containing protein [Umezawaea sp. Da 62-37]
MTTPATAATPVPKQLPPTPHEFVNRTQELRRLTWSVNNRTAEARPVVFVLSGMSGVGKTAAGIHWAHENRDRFDGGQLYADLSAYRHRGGLGVSDVLAAFLRALGVHEEYIPIELPERSALFRTRTAESRVLIMLDDVGQAAEVRPLIPGSSDSVVIVTSRSRLSGLAMDGAEMVDFHPLSPLDSSSLMARMLPAGQLGSDPQAVRELVRLCAGLPIALRVAGARLMQRRHWSVSRLVRYLSDDDSRLDRLSPEGGQRVFDIVFQDLPVPAQRVYRILGVHPGPDFGPQVAAAAAGMTLDEVDDALVELREANLVEELGGERYRLHDLIRLHAQRRAVADETTAEQDAALRAIVNWYLLGAAAADHAVLGAARWRLADHDLSEWGTPFTAATGMSWFEAERANLLAAVRTAVQRGWNSATWQLCEALWAFYHGRKLFNDWIEAHELGVLAAANECNTAALARMHNHLARAHMELGQLSKANDDLNAAWSAATESGNSRALAVVLESVGLLRRDQRRFDEAAKSFRQAREINEVLNDQRGIAMQNYHLGEVLVRSGESAAAIAVLDAALDASQELNDEMAVARTCIVLGTAYKALDRNADALVVLRSAVATTRERRQPVKEAQALEVLAVVAKREEDLALFRDSALRLVELYRESGNPRVDEVSGWIHRDGH